MGLAMRVAKFGEGRRPDLSVVVARAESRGGLALEFDGHYVRFADQPVVVISIGETDYQSIGPDRPVVDAIGLADHSGRSMVLMELLSIVLVELGGTMDPPPDPMPLPLTLAGVRRQQRNSHVVALGGCMVLSLVLLLVMAAVATTAIGAWHGMQALFQ